MAIRRFCTSVIVRVFDYGLDCAWLVLTTMLGVTSAALPFRRMTEAAGTKAGMHHTGRPLQYLKVIIDVLQNISANKAVIASEAWRSGRAAGVIDDLLYWQRRVWIATLRSR